MSADVAAAMVRQVCVSFEGAAFSLVDAARRMVQFHPSAPSQAFAEGWDTLTAGKEIVTDGVTPGKYRLDNSKQKIFNPMPEDTRWSCASLKR
jgi:hypothetical protein